MQRALSFLRLTLIIELSTSFVTNVKTLSWLTYPYINLESYKKDSEEKGYVLGASGYTYKTKKAKGEIIDEAWVVKVTKILGGVWDDGE